MDVYFSNHTFLIHVIFARDDCRMVVYGYKTDTLVAVYPTLHGTDAPRVHIFKNTAVYFADWLAENYRHYLKIRFVLQQLQVVQRAELVSLATPRPNIVIQIIAPLVRVVEADFSPVVCSFSSVPSITPVTIKPVKMHSQRLPIRFLFTSVVFMPLKFICYYPVLSFLSIYPACDGTLPAF